MPRMSDGAGRSPAAPRLTQLSFGREEINPDAIDHTVMRFFVELVRQFSVGTNIKEEQLKANDVLRERQARILAQLERLLERIAHLESDRVAARMGRVAANDEEDLRRALEARIDRIIEDALEEAEPQKAG